jgi:hypothetical protein
LRKANEVALYRQVVDEIRAAITARRFGAIVLDGVYYEKVMAESYREAGPLFGQPDVFYPLVGFRTRPERLLLPKQASRDSEGGR